MPDNLQELIEEAERLAERAPHGNWVAKDWSVFTDGDACILVAYTATNNARRTPQHQATCRFIAHAHNLLPKLITAYREAKQASLEVDAKFAAELSDRLSGIVDGLTKRVGELEVARDKLAAELDRLRAQAERYRLDALRLAAKVDPEEFAVEWEAEIADLRTVRADLDNERAVRAVQAGKLAHAARLVPKPHEMSGFDDPDAPDEVKSLIDSSYAFWGLEDER